MDKAIFAAGPFWGVESYFQSIKGVIATRVGYMGGNKPNPTYDDVHTGLSGYAEVVEISFFASIINFEALVEHFFDRHDPTQLNRQGKNIGTQYRSAIFYVDEKQRKIATQVLEKRQASGEFEDPIVTTILPQTEFWQAEEDHQNYYQKQGVVATPPRTI